MAELAVKFKKGTGVTTDPMYPAFEPGCIIFDESTAVLYIDTESTRVPIKDNLKLSLTGGSLSGTIEVLGTGGTRVALTDTGNVVGEWIQATADIRLLSAPSKIAVVDDDGYIRTRTLVEILNDLGISNTNVIDDVQGKVTDTYTVVDGLGVLTFGFDGSASTTTQVLTKI